MRNKSVRTQHQGRRVGSVRTVKSQVGELNIGANVITNPQIVVSVKIQR